MSLLRTAQLNGHEPHAYLKDVLTRLPTQGQRRRNIAASSLAAAADSRLVKSIKTGLLAAYDQAQKKSTHAHFVSQGETCHEAS